jgi:hypothetical protein
MAKGQAGVASPQLFPLKAIWCGPHGLGSVDCVDGCFCENGHGYVIKTDNPHALVPHSEWFCSHLAQRCGLHGPGFAAVEHTNGNVWFGSQWVIGAIKDWWLSAHSGGFSNN